MYLAIPSWHVSLPCVLIVLYRGMLRWICLQYCSLCHIVLLTYLIAHPVCELSCLTGSNACDIITQVKPAAIKEYLACRGLARGARMRGPKVSQQPLGSLTQARSSVMLLSTPRMCSLEPLCNPQVQALCLELHRYHRQTPALLKCQIFVW